MNNFRLIILILFSIIISSCGSKNKNSSNPKWDDGQTDKETGEVSSALKILPIEGASFTKKILIKTNEELKSAGIKQRPSMIIAAPLFQNNIKFESNLSFNKDVYLSTVEKIAKKRDEFTAYEVKQKYALKTASYATDSIFSAANTVTLGSAGVIIEPLKSLRNDAFEAAIKSTIEDHSIQLGKVISALAQNTGDGLVRVIRNSKDSLEEIEDLRKTLLSSAEKTMSPSDFQLFSSQLREEYLASALTYALADLQNVLVSSNDTHRILNEATIYLYKTKSRLDELTQSLKSFAENNQKYINEQKEILKNINISIQENRTGISASLVKLDFLTQMTFGSMPASMQLEYLKSSPQLIPLSNDEKFKLLKSLEYKVVAENSLQVISNIRAIGINLDFLGKDTIRSIDISSTLITSAISFMAGSPMGYLNGVASLSGIFSKNKQDPRLNIIIENQRKTFEALISINENINLLRQEINSGFQKINEEIYLSRSMMLENIRLHDLASCSLLSKNFELPESYFKIKEKMESEGNERVLSNCLDKLVLFFSKQDSNDETSFTTNLSFRKNLKEESSIVNNYSNIFSSLEEADSEDIRFTKFNLKNLIDPQLLQHYINSLLNNHHWFDLVEGNNSGWHLVSQENIQARIAKNKISEKMLKNALYIVEANLYQYRIWSGASSLDFYYEKYKNTSLESANKIKCKEDPKNVICLSIENPWFFSNLFNHVIQQTMTYNFVYASLKIAPNDPDHLNSQMTGAFKFVWLGKGADPLFSGEVIMNEQWLKKYESGMYVKISTADKTMLYPVPSLENIKTKRAFDMPKADLLLGMKKLIQDEIIDFNLRKILEENEYQQIVQFL